VAELLPKTWDKTLDRGLKSRKNGNSAVSSTEKTSALLRRLFDELPGDQVPVRYVVRQLRRRSFGGISIFLAVLSLVPGVSIFTGLALFIIGIQILFGFRGPLLPKIIGQRQISSEALLKIGNPFLDKIEKFERYVKPRWLFLTTPPLSNLVGLLIAALAVVVMVPLPFSNMPPAFALILISTGLLERDGLLISVGIVVAVAAFAIGVLVVGVAYESYLLYLSKDSV
jgi:hypothetical protein